MKTSPLSDVMEEFLEAISSIRSQVDGRIVLIGYNNAKYDMEVMKTELLRCGVSTEKISSMNVVCADLFQFVRKNWKLLFPVYPGNLKMTTVYNELCGDQKKYQHDALEDAEKLRKIYHAISGRVDKRTFETCIFPFPVVEALPLAEVPRPGKSEPQQGPRRIKRKSTDESNPQLGRPDVKKARV